MNLKKFIKKLRFLDYLIIFAILLTLIIIFKFFHPEEKWVDVTVFANNVSFSSSQSFKKGDVEKNSSGKEIARIESVQIYDTPNTIAANKDIYLTILVLTSINQRNGELSYKNQIIKVGSPIVFLFSQGMLSAKIASIGKINEKKETRTITVALYNRWPWFADSLKIGDGEMDANGNKTIVLLSKDTKTAEITVTTATGETLLRTDPQKVDMTLTLKVQLQIYDKDLIYHYDEKLAVGQTFSFNIGDTIVKDAQITSIK